MGAWDQAAASILPFVGSAFGGPAGGAIGTMLGGILQGGAGAGFGGGGGRTGGQEAYLWQTYGTGDVEVIRQRFCNLGVPECRSISLTLPLAAYGMTPGQALGLQGGSVSPMGGYQQPTSATGLAPPGSSFLAPGMQPTQFGPGVAVGVGLGRAAVSRVCAAIPWSAVWEWVKRNGWNILNTVGIASSVIANSRGEADQTEIRGCAPPPSGGLRALRAALCHEARADMRRGVPGAALWWSTRCRPAGPPSGWCRRPRPRCCRR